jgi:hypothetical protein
MFPVGQYYMFAMTFNDGSWSTLSDLRTSPNFLGEFDFSVVDNIPVVSSGKVEAMIGNATSAFMTTTGFTPASGIQSVGGMFIKPIIGGGLMMLKSLLPWIIAIIMFIMIVKFAFRAFVMYKHNAKNINMNKPSVIKKANERWVKKYGKTGDPSTGYSND